MKKIVVLRCSPRAGGNSDLLANAFISGLEGKDHLITDLTIGRFKISPCIGCYKCFKTDKPCIINDDMQQVYDAFLEADVFVIAAPIYYFNLPAQYKAMMDRLHALDMVDKLPKNKAFALLLTAADDKEEIFDLAILETKRAFERYLNWDYLGSVLVNNVGAKGEIIGSQKLIEVEKLATSL